MPVLPLIDLLIMVGWTSLMGGFLLKAVYLTTAYRPLVVGMSPLDFVLFAGICLFFALTLAARTWVKYHEPELMARRRRRAREVELPEAGAPPQVLAADPDRAALNRP